MPLQTGSTAHWQGSRGLCCSKPGRSAVLSVKYAILRRYNINEETYRKRFRALKFLTGQTPTEITTRLADLAGKWLKDCTTVDEVKDAVVKEQLLTTLPEDVRVWVTDRKPRTAAETGQLAEDYLQARSPGVPPLISNRPPPGPCPRCGDPNHWARHCPTYPRPEGHTQMRPNYNRPHPSCQTDQSAYLTAPNPTDLTLLRHQSVSTATRRVTMLLTVPALQRLTYPGRQQPKEFSIPPWNCLLHKYTR